MISQHGVNGTLQDDIFFTEKSIPSSNVIKHIKVEISRQNSSLSEIKSAMARDAKSCGANVVMNFKYGQSAHKGLKLISFKWDSESWHGEGDAVSIP